MSDHPLPPAPPPSEWQGQPAATEPPQAIKTAVTVVWAVVVLSVLSVILTFLYLDDLVEAAGENLTSAEQDAARSFAIVVAIITLLVFGALWVVCGVFLRKGANWARIVLTVLSVLGLAFGLFGLFVDQPAIFLVLGVVELVLYVVLLYFLWRKESTDFINAHRAR